MVEFNDSNIGIKSNIIILSDYKKRKENSKLNPLNDKRLGTILDRANSLPFIYYRYILEIIIKNGGDVTSEELHLNSGIRGLSSVYSFTKFEKRLINCEIGAWTTSDFVYGSFSLQMLGSILWYISALNKLPEYETLEDFDFPILVEVVENLDLLEIKYRDDNELKFETERTRMWCNRCTLESTVIKQLNEGIISDRAEFDAEAQNMADYAINSNILKNLIENDFPLLGKSIKDSSGKDISLLYVKALPRLMTFEWLFNVSVDWDSFMSLNELKK